MPGKNVLLNVNWTEKTRAKGCSKSGGGPLLRPEEAVPPKKVPSKAQWGKGDHQGKAAAAGAWTRARGRRISQLVIQTG